jgi:hypothetical protein
MAGGMAGGTAGGSTAGGMAGGSTAGGSAGGSTAGGTAGGSTAGGTAGGSTAGGMAGGSTAGGMTGGSTAGGTAGGLDAGCIRSGGTDWPDENGLDSNCDGVDGDATLAAFVDGTNGLDTNAGSRVLPFRTIARALDAGLPQVLVSSGTYAESLGLGTGGFGIYGGYNASSSWARTAMRPILSGPLVIVGDGGTLALDFLRVATPNSTSSRIAAYALIVEDAPGGVVISRSEFASGRGGDGLDGPPGGVGAAGSPGLPGGDGVDGGLGGPGGASTCGAAGMTGARGGTTGMLSGETVTSGGLGGGREICEGPPCAGNSGGSGLDGADGGRGPDGVPGSTPGLITNRRWGPVDGRSGDAGQPGSAGRPGGGGGAVFDNDAGVVARGGGSGGTGAGGCPGRGGSGAESGGASIAALLINASPSFDRCAFSTSGGGNGGSGGPGGPGGLGGLGGASGAGEQLGGLIAGDGGVSGRGGSGGPGGNGGSGAGGPSIGVWCEGASTPVFMAPTFTVGTGGTGAVTGLSAQRTGTCP